jgi:hypothetical protein
MPIPNNEINSDKDVFFTESFKTLVRSEKELLKRSAHSKPIVEKNVLYAYRNDIYRLLRSFEIPSYMWWATAYINGFEDPTSDITNLSEIFIIDESVLAGAISRSNTVQG